MDGFLVGLTLATALGCGLTAGVFFAFSTFVMPALGRLPAAEGIAAMQQINVKAINPWFMAALFGTAATSIATMAVVLADWHESYGPYALAGGALDLLGTIGVTMFFNVPRNDALAEVDPRSPEAAGVWARYLTEWTAWNHVRHHRAADRGGPRERGALRQLTWRSQQRDRDGQGDQQQRAT